MTTFLIIYAVVFLVVYNLMQATDILYSPDELFGNPFGAEMNELEIILSAAAEVKNGEQDDFFQNVMYEFHENGGSLQPLIDDIVFDWELELTQHVQDGEDPTQIYW